MVSVIIPMYNREDTILMAVNSVLNQTYADLELLIVDDCSTDQSVEIISRIKDSRVRLIQCDKNSGACAARNIGINEAKGDIIAFHDSDDSWHADKLEKSLFYLKKTNSDLVFSALQRTDNAKKCTVPSYNLNLEKDKLARLMRSNCMSTQTMVMKRNVLEKIRFDESLPRFQDWDFALQVLKAGYNVYYIEEALVDYYVGDDSISKSGNKALTAYKLLEKKYADILQNSAFAREGFYYYFAYEMETSNENGSRYFWKAFCAEKDIGHFCRFILSKMHLFRPISACITSKKQEDW